MSPRAIVSASFLLPAIALAVLVGCEASVEAGARPHDADTPEPLNTQLPNPYERPWPPEYERPTSWGTLPEGRGWGSTSAVHVDVDGTSIWVFERCGAGRGQGSCAGSELDPILKFDADGRHLASFGAGMFLFPHGLHVDEAGNVWAADARGPTPRELELDPNASEKGSQIIKFSPEGEVLLTLGTPGVTGDPPDALTEPTAVVAAPNGDIFVAEGHSGETVNRISKFAADGTFIMSWGSSGSEPGEFNVPHDLAMDSQGRVFVADRKNYRIQIFDQEGNYIDQWKQFGMPSGIYISPDDILYATDSHSWGDEPRLDNERWLKGIRIGSARTGEVSTFIPDLEAGTRANSGAEGVGADRAGNVFAAVVRRQGIERHPAPENWDRPR